MKPLPPHAHRWWVAEGGQPVCLVWLHRPPRVEAAACPPEQGFEVPGNRRPCGCWSDPAVFGHTHGGPAERRAW